MNRKIRYGMVGGGRGAFIGAVHRIAAAMEQQSDLVCGGLSSEPVRSKASGADLFLPPERRYGTLAEMIESGTKLQVGQRMDFIATVTPNRIHLPQAKIAGSCERTARKRGRRCACDTIAHPHRTEQLQARMSFAPQALDVFPLGTTAGRENGGGGGHDGGGNGQCDGNNGRPRRHPLIVKLFKQENGILELLWVLAIHGGVHGCVRWITIPSWLVVFVDAALATVLLLVLGKLVMKALADAINVCFRDLLKIAKAWRMLMRSLHLNRAAHT